MNDVYFNPRAGEISLNSPSHRGHNETHRFEKRGGGGIYHEKRIRGDWDPITELIISPASVKIARYYRARNRRDRSWASERKGGGLFEIPRLDDGFVNGILIL